MSKEWSMPTRLPSLDGFRALAVAIVVFFHSWAHWNVHNGELGVLLFFVISGFIITRTLLAAPALKAFYRRRIAKLLPSLYVYLAVVVVIRHFIGDGPPLRYVVRAALFLTGDHRFQQGSHAVNHTWSLSVEEVFYLLWAPVLGFCLRRGRSAGPYAFAGLAVALAAHLVHPDYAGDPGAKVLLFAARFQGIAIGCLAGLYEERLRGLAIRLRLLAWPMLFAPHAARAFAPAAFHRATVLLCPLLASLAAATLILAYTAPRAGPAFRVLNWPWVAAVGRASYSIYLWQQILLLPFGDRTFWHPPSIAGIPLALALGLVMYHLLEEPANRWLRGSQQSASKMSSSAASEASSSSAYMPTSSE
jgi:peptidoglycan/LPS O-acetylase OafA/YrhL